MKSHSSRDSSEDDATGGADPALSTITADRLLDALPDAIIAVDPQGVIRFVTSAAQKLTGYARGELVGAKVETLVPGSSRHRHTKIRKRFTTESKSRAMGTPLSIDLLRKDGTHVPVDIGLGSFVLGDGRWTVAAIRDESARRDIELQIRQTSEHYRLAFENNMAPMLFTDPDDVIIDANSAFCEMIGRGREEILNVRSSVFTHPEDVGITEDNHLRLASGEKSQIRYNKRYLHKDGRTIIVEISKSPARDPSGDTLYYVISGRDVTAEKELAARLTLQALHDPLTGLANRALFEDRLIQAHARTVRNGGMVAVLLFDLDDFKGVNDTFGHTIGDQLLTTIAHRLELETRSSDTLCRFGGDEFLYLAEGVTSIAEAEMIGLRLLEVIAEPLVVNGVTIEQTASLGIATWEDEDTDPSDVIRDADVAMYAAKRQRLTSSHLTVFTPELREQATRRFSLVHELRRSLHTGELTMHYQPIVDLETVEVVGFEALMRWLHPERGLIVPSVFIPLAEQSDLILELGQFALEHAIDVASSWERDGASINHAFVSVNLSAHQFQDPTLVARIDGLLSTTGVAPARLVLEITESVALDNIVETKSVVERLRGVGVGLALDDFGTGYTSLAYLAELSPKIIKIDRSFIVQASRDSRSEVMLEAIITLGNNLNSTMLAEGIETRDQLELLRRLGCTLGQGYLFSHAVPADDLFDWPARFAIASKGASAP